MAQDVYQKVDFDLQSARRVERVVHRVENQPNTRALNNRRTSDTTLQITGNRGKSGCYEAVEIFPPTDAIDTSTGTLSIDDIGTILDDPQTVEVLNPYEVGLDSHVLQEGDIVSAEPHGVTTEKKRLFKVRNCLTAGDCASS